MEVTTNLDHQCHIPFVKHASLPNRDILINGGGSFAMAGSMLVEEVEGNEIEFRIHRKR